eukprot:gene9914-7782_t
MKSPMKSPIRLRQSPQPLRLNTRISATSGTSGSTIPADSFMRVGKVLGEGSFGEAFEGSILHRGEEQRVVIKRYKNVQGGEAMGRMELAMNQYVRKTAAAKHCASYLGNSSVMEGETSELDEGLHLVWEYEGDKTLAHYLKTKDPLGSLAADMEVDRWAVPAMVAKQLFEGLAAFHSVGLVHRDVKPHNMIFSEAEGRFKIIDLYVLPTDSPHISKKVLNIAISPLLWPSTNLIASRFSEPPPLLNSSSLSLTPSCSHPTAPSQYVLPTDSPHISKNVFNMAISPLLWAKHKPDRFDSWSAGIVLLQLAVPSLRSSKGLRQFNKTFGPKFNYNLRSWKRNSHLPKKEFEILDAMDGAGWQLLGDLLQPRMIGTEEGVVSFHDKHAPRISANQALQHRFIKEGIYLESPTPVASAGPRGLFQGLLGNVVSAAFGTKQTVSAPKALHGGKAQGLIGNVVSAAFGNKKTALASKASGGIKFQASVASSSDLSMGNPGSHALGHDGNQLQRANNAFKAMLAEFKSSPVPIPLAAELAPVEPPSAKALSPRGLSFLIFDRLAGGRSKTPTY